MNTEERFKEELRTITDLLRTKGWDTVQIFVSKFDNKEKTTYMMSDGEGLIGQRIHQTAMWVAMCEDNMRTEIEESSNEDE